MSDPVSETGEPRIPDASTPAPVAEPVVATAAPAQTPLPPKKTWSRRKKVVAVPPAAKPQAAAAAPKPAPAPEPAKSGVEFVEDEYDRLVRGQRERKLAAMNGGASAEELLERDLEQSAVIDPDPNLHYKWVNRVGKDGVRVLEHQGRGFVLVRPESTASKARPACGIKRTDVNFGRCYILGDLILMAESKDNHLRRHQRSIDRMNFMANESRETAKENINKIARDEIGKSYSHKDAAFDFSTQGKEIEGSRPLPKPDFSQSQPIVHPTTATE